MREYGPAKHDPGLDDTRRQASFAGNESVKNTRSRIEQYNLEYFPRQIPHGWCEAGCYVRRASEYSRLVERRLSNTPADLEDGGQLGTTGRTYARNRRQFPGLKSCQGTQ